MASTGPVTEVGEFPCKIVGASLLKSSTYDMLRLPSPADADVLHLTTTAYPHKAISRGGEHRTGRPRLSVDVGASLRHDSHFMWLGRPSFQND
jgi:hypothetical protein